MTTIEIAYIDGYLAGHAAGGAEVEEYGKTYSADESDAKESFRQWLQSIPALDNEKSETTEGRIAGGHTAFAGFEGYPMPASVTEPCPKCGQPWCRDGIKCGTKEDIKP